MDTERAKEKVVVLNRQAHLVHATAWKPTAWLPNQEGFRFIGLAESGTEIVCQVMRDSQGVHTVSPVAVRQLKGWREITPADEAALQEVVWEDTCSSPL